MATVQELNQIHQTIANDPSLRTRLEGISSQDDYARFAAEVGRKQGFDFTEQDVQSALREASATGNRPEGELSREQLESVAGGAWCSLTRWWYERFTSGAVAC